jgi:hypothetical protein
MSNARNRIRVFARFRPFDDEDTENKAGREESHLQYSTNAKSVGVKVCTCHLNFLSYESLFTRLYWRPQRSPVLLFAHTNHVKILSRCLGPNILVR